MKTVLSICAFLLVCQTQAQNMDWWDNLHNYPAAAGPDRFDYISISPGFMGPNALRVPVLGNGIIDNRISFDVRWENHQGNGDITNNAFLQLNFPIKKDQGFILCTQHSFRTLGCKYEDSGRAKNDGDFWRRKHDWRYCFWCDV